MADSTMGRRRALLASIAASITSFPCPFQANLTDQDHDVLGDRAGDTGTKIRTKTRGPAREQQHPTTP